MFPRTVSQLDDRGGRDDMRLGPLPLDTRVTAQGFSCWAGWSMAACRSGGSSGEVGLSPPFLLLHGAWDFHPMDLGLPES